MQIYIERFADDEKIGCFGRLCIFKEQNKIFECYTIERPWLNNTPFISCIPVGSYALEDHKSEKYGETYAIVGGSVGHYEGDNVRKINGFGRYTCLFHAANIFTSVLGCVGLGSALGVLDGLWCVTNSRLTVEKFLEILKGSKEAHSLVITNKFNKMGLFNQIVN